MKKLALLAMLICLTADICRATDVIKSMIDSAVAVAGQNFWYVDDTTQPKGGYIFKFYLDLDGDGVDEMFVSLNEVERKGVWWTVFKKDAAGEYQKIKDSLFLSSALHTKVENGIRKYSFYVPQKQTEGGSYLGYFWLDASGAWHDETHVLTDAEQATMDGNDADTSTDGKPDEQKIAQKLNLGSSVALTIKKVLLAKYSQNSAAPWRDVKTDFTLSQQYKDPADGADIASVANWQPPASP